MPIDYSKWKDIEVSDDEDDTHPNIDTPSLFRWRHQARVERQQEFDEKLRQTETDITSVNKQIDKMYAELKSKNINDDRKAELVKKIEAAKSEVSEKRSTIQQEEKLRPWNVDTISSEGFNRTIVNKDVARSTEKLTDDQKSDRMQKFVKDNHDDLKKFGWLSRFDDSKAFLLERPHLACDDTANYLVLRCLDLAIEDKMGAMEQVAHQCIAMQYLLELAKQLDRDPRSCISQFFTKIQVAEHQYKAEFAAELEAFKLRIRKRAKVKLEEEVKRLEEEERQARLGPGGLDPVEVFESLPKALQECFESQDVAKLQATIASMPTNEAKDCMRRCVAAGLWNPATDDPNTNAEDGFRIQTEREEISCQSIDSHSTDSVD